MVTLRKRLPMLAQDRSSDRLQPPVVQLGKLSQQGNQRTSPTCSGNLGVSRVTACNHQLYSLANSLSEVTKAHPTCSGNLGVNRVTACNHQLYSLANSLSKVTTHTCPSNVGVNRVIAHNHRWHR